MNCHDARKLFPLYYDSEGDAEMQLEVGDHLAMCPECKQWFERRGGCESALGVLVNRGVANRRLWGDIEQSVLGHGSRPVRRRSWSRAAVSTGAVLAAAAAIVLLWQRRDVAGANDHLLHLAATAHDRYIAGTWQVEVADDSIDVFEQRLRARAGFAVRCPPEGQGGFRLAGGGVCDFEGERIAHIVGHVDGRPVSLIVLRGESLKRFPATRAHLAAHGGTHHCREGRYQMVISLLHGHVVIVLGEANDEVLGEVLAGYGSRHASVGHGIAPRRPSGRPPAKFMTELAGVSSRESQRSPWLSVWPGQRHTEPPHAVWSRAMEVCCNCRSAVAGRQVDRARLRGSIRLTRGARMLRFGTT